MVDDTDEGNKSSDDLENVHDGLQNLETTDSDTAEGNNNPVNHYDRSTLRSHGNSNKNMAGVKPLNSGESEKEKQLGESSCGMVHDKIDTVGSEKAISNVRCIKSNVCATVVVRGTQSTLRKG